MPKMNPDEETLVEEATKTVNVDAQNEKQDETIPTHNGVLEVSLGDLDIDLKDPLGHGGFCMVYKAKFKREISSYAVDTNTTYALKRLKTGVRKAIMAREQLGQEINFLATLRHDNIINVYGHGFDKQNNSPFLFCEVLADTLEPYVEKWHHKSNRYFAPHYTPRDHVRARLRQIVLGVCHGMAYMHSKKVVFRDLKPDNIGFTSTGGVKLFDFGLAVRLEPPCYKCLQQAGTVRYLAPEIARAQPHDTKADVYSFGILLWQIITGRLPYEKELGVDDGFKLAGKTKFLPPGKRPNLSYVEAEELQVLLTAAWFSRPDERPTFPDIIARLDRFLGPTPADTEPTIFKIRELAPEAEKPKTRRERPPEPDPMVWWSA